MKRIKYKTNFAIVIVISFVIIIFVNMISEQMFFRWDMTRDKLYSISPATRNILKRLTDNLIVKVVLTKNIPPQAQNIRLAITDLVNELRIYGGGKVKLKFITPETPSDAEPEFRDLISKNYIVPGQVGIFEKGERKLIDICAGLVMSYQDKVSSIPIVLPENLPKFEYEVASIILKFVETSEKKIGYLSGFSDKNINRNFSIVKEAIEKDYKLELINPVYKKEIDKDIQTLLVINPKNIDELTKFKIDQFIMSGRNVLFLIDSVEVPERTTFGYEVSHNLGDLLEHYGVKLNKNLILDKVCATINLPRRLGNITVVSFMAYPYFVGVIDENFNKKTGIFGSIKQILLPYTSSIDEVKITGENKDIHYYPLFSTTNNSWEETEHYNVDPEKFLNIPRTQLIREQGNLLDAYISLNVPRDKLKKRTLGALVEGYFDSFYKGKPIPKPEVKGKEGEQQPAVPTEKIEHSLGKSKIIVIGSSSFISNEVVSAFESNIDLFMNMIDKLTLSEDFFTTLVNIRSKKTEPAPIDLGVNFNKNVYYLGNVLLVPIILVAFGILYATFRSIRKTIPYQNK